ncbi:Probable nucleoredoxin 1 [Linum grandiflorum]
MDDSLNLLSSLLSGQDRDFLIRSNGEQVKVSSLTGKKKTLGLYFSATWCKPCQKFTPTLLEAYEELKGDFEVVFISSDEDDESFTKYFSKMPWLAIPFSDSDVRASLKEIFKAESIPHLVILDAQGRVSCRGGVKIVSKYGAQGYPFTEDKLRLLMEEEENANKNQTLRSLLVSPSRDYLISKDGTKTDILELEGKMVCLYVAVLANSSCAEFTPKLVDFYNEIKRNGERSDLEVVLLSFDSDEEKFSKGFETMPWLAVPFQDKTCAKLLDYFQLRSIPTVIVIGGDGKTVNLNVAELIDELGAQAYPFCPEKLAEFEAIKSAELESQTLESILVHGDQDFVVDKSGAKVQVSELVGKTILLYFSAHWCAPCRKFTPKLIKAYHEIKPKSNNNFEVIFISSDRDQPSFDEYFSTMPWLAVPFDPDTKTVIQKKFKIAGIPAVVAIGPNGKTLTKEARDALTVHGVDAYPFTEEHLKKLEGEEDEKAKKWPEKMRDEELHEHEVVRKKGGRGRGYMCDGCKEVGGGWSYSCKPCDFDVHLECGIKEEEIVCVGKEDGWVCEGDVCRKA